MSYLSNIEMQNQEALLPKSWNLPLSNSVPASLLGLCALSINNDNCYLAYPGSATIGEVQVFDTINLVRIFVNAVSTSKDAVWGNYYIAQRGITRRSGSPASVCSASYTDASQNAGKENRC